MEVSVMEKLVPFSHPTVIEISFAFLDLAKMIFWAALLFTISTVNSFVFDSRDCFEHTEMNCMENFVDAVFYRNGGVDECSELRSFVDCSSDAVDECFGDERNAKVDKGLEELENLFKDSCAGVSSGDNSDFDEETYSHIKLTATFSRKKKAPHSTTDKKTSVSSDSKKCFSERKKICWDTFEDAVIHSVFYRSIDLDKCSVLRHFVICSRLAADDCFEDEHDEDAEEILEVWENKSKEFCETDITDGKPVTVVVPSIREESGLMEVSNVINITGLSPRPPRKNNCMIREFETMVLMGTSTEDVGAWFQDAMPTNKTENKYYSIFASDTNHLYEYKSIDDFNKRESKIYEIPFPFIGTGHLVYNGSFYYHEAKSQMLVRFDFNHERSNSIRIEDVSYNDEHYLYSSEIGYMDVMADENGLWVVYSAKDTNNTLVRKIHPYTLVTEYMWNLTLPDRRVAEMFIACGVLYAINSTTIRDPRILFAFDLYQNKVLEVDILFSIPFKKYSMVAYNPKHGEIVTWLRNDQFVHPITFGTIDLGQPDKKEHSKCSFLC